MGRKDEAGQTARQLLETRKQRYIEAYGLAVVYLGLGDKCLSRSTGWSKGIAIVTALIWAISGLIHSSLRCTADPRFEALAEKIMPAREFRTKTTSK